MWQWWLVQLERLGFLCWNKCPYFIPGAVLFFKSNLGIMNLVVILWLLKLCWVQGTHPFNTSAFLSADGLNAFRSFLQSEFSDENIEFWMSCEEFKKTKDPVKMAAKAKKIYEDFIQAEGPREVTNCFIVFRKIRSVCHKTVSCSTF